MQRSPIPLPAEYYAEPRRGVPLPDRVVYVTGGQLVPFIPADPALPPPVTASVATYRGRLPSGLSPKADSMARMVARGIGGSDAFRAAYGATSHPRAIASRCGRIMRHKAFRGVVDTYRARLEEEGRQQSFEVRDFVMSRLVTEAQHADSAPARIRATELLGKTEAMFTDVRRTDKVINPKDLEQLKAQLNQRLSRALQRLMPGLSQDTGTTIQGVPVNSGMEEPHPEPIPLISSGGALRSGDTIPNTHPPDSTGVPFSLGPIPDNSQGGTFSAGTIARDFQSVDISEMSRADMAEMLHRLLDAQYRASRPREMEEGDL